MKVGIIGLPQTGKTSLYNALTRSNVNLGQCDPKQIHVGVVAVPDPRFDYAVEKCRPKKATPATIEFTEGGPRIEMGGPAGRTTRFGNDFFAHLRLMDALVLVVRAFEDERVPPPENGLNPLREAQQVQEELIFADLMVIEGRLERLEKARQQKRQNPAEAVEYEVLQCLKAHLETMQPVRTFPLTPEEERALRSYAFVSGKPLLLVANISENQVGQEKPESLAPLAHFAAEQHLPLIPLCARAEMEVAQMAPQEEQEFLQALGIAEPARNRLIRAAYEALGLISFFTVGEDEVRAWTIPQGTNAVGAAEKIHSDLARGFIRAEVIAFDDFRSAGGCWEEAKAAGKMRLEGKEYIVKDGDIVHIRFKV